MGVSPLLWWLIPVAATLAAVVWLYIARHRGERVARRDLDQFGAALGNPLPDARAEQVIDLTDVKIIDAGESP